MLADGSRRAGEGSLNLLDAGAKVLSYGRLRETLTPQSGQIMASLRQEEASSLSVTLSNEGPDEARPMSRIEALENILGATGELIIGFPGRPGPGIHDPLQRPGPRATPCAAASCASA